jgi:ribonuclease HII
LPDCSGLVGVDEAGRGAFAGPVVATTVWLKTSFYQDKRRHAGRQVNDSKQLTAAQRTACFAVIEEWRAAGLVRVAVASASVEEIAAHNIFGATRLAMDRCLQALHAASGGLPTAGEDTPLFTAATPPPLRPRILVDGRPLRPFSWPHEGLIDGDAKSFAIAAASIVAKVTRDRKMAELDGEFPGYGLARHKGYGTKEHCAALREKGPCREHRLLFLRKLEAKGELAQQAEMGW